MPSDRELLLGNGNRPRPAHDYGTADQRLEQQHQTLRDQNTALEQLSVGVTSVRNIAGHIHSEVDSQNVVLDGLGADMSDASRGVTAASQKVERVGGSAYSFRTFCILLWPLVLLIILVVEGIVHFIF